MPTSELSIKRWLLAPPAPPQVLHTYHGMSAALAQILYSRGYTEPGEAAAFLNADLNPEGQWLQYKKKPSIDRALARIWSAIQKREPIVVYGDFDADGVTSTALLVTTLRALGANVHPYIPHRIDEGYGLNTEALHKLHARGARVVITVDCGIRSVEEVATAPAGLDIIITDHHSVGEQIPNAYAVINPKRDDCAYTEDMLAGVGVAFRLAEALITVARARKWRAPSDKDPVSIKVDDLYDLVAIGTVADLAPLNRIENRALVKRGLSQMNGAPRLGLRVLLEIAALKGMIDAGTIGFAIGPRLNAAGRLDSAMAAYDLLACADDGQAMMLAQRLQDLNVQRQELTRSAQELVRAQLIDSGQMDAPLIFASHASFLPGIVGLVAGRLTEEFYRPAVVLEEGEGESRASCRSIPQFDITHALDQCADLLIRHGGHAQAAGFTVENANIPALRARLLELAGAAIGGQELLPTIRIDAELEPRQLTFELIEDLARLEPTGHSNPLPVFMTRRLNVLDHWTVGKDAAHLKLKLGRAGQPAFEAIGFRMGALSERLVSPIDIAYQLEINEYSYPDKNTGKLQVKRSVQARMIDIRAHQPPEAE